MSDFDPYRKWLGIKPEEQPPHHYRLLGISLYEDDPDVIDAAVEQRVTYLQTCASGPNLKHSQKILNEVAEARNVLLDAEKKEAYAAALKAKLEEQTAVKADAQTESDRGAESDWKVKRKRVLPTDQGSGEAEAGEASNSQSDSEAGAAAEPGAKPASTVSDQLRRRRNRSTGILLAVLLGVALTGGFAWWLIKGDGTEVIEDLADASAGAGHDSDNTGQENTGATSTGGESGESGTEGSTNTGSSGETTTQTGTTNTGEGGTGTKLATAGETGTVSTTGESGSKPKPHPRDAFGIAARKTGIAMKLAGHTSDVVAVAISNDLNTVASGEANGLVLTHSLADKSKTIDRFQVDGKILGLTFNSSGDRYAVLTPRTIYVRDFAKQRIAWREHPLPDPEFSCITHRPFSTFYLTGRLDGTSVLRGKGESGNPPSRERLLGHTAPVTAVAMSATGRIAVTASEDNSLRVWHQDSKQQLGEYPVEGLLTKVAISPDERRIIGLSRRGLHIWDLHTQQPFPVVPVHDGNASDVALLGGQPFAVTTGSDGTIQVASLETLQTTVTIKARDSGSRILAVSDDGVAAVTAGNFPDSSGSTPDFDVSVWRLPVVDRVTFGVDDVPQDVLAQVKLKRDLIRGDWKLEDGLLVSGTKQALNEIHLPATVPDEYTLDIRLRRSAGMGPLRIRLPFHDTAGTLLINGDGGRMSGLQFIDGKTIKENETGFRRQWIVSWKNEHTIRATVTKEGITASVDGRTIFDWKGTPDQLKWFPESHPDWDPAWPNVREIRMTTGPAQYTFSRIQLLAPGADASTSNLPVVAVTPPVERVAVPSEAEQQAEIDRLRTSLADAYADTKNRAALVAELIRLAKDSPDAAVTQFAAWGEAASLAAESGDAATAFLALDRMDERFEGSFYELKENVFSALARRRDPATLSQLAPFGFNWVEDLIEAEKFEEATIVLSRSRGAAVRLKDVRLRELADYFNTRIRTLARGYDAVKEQAATLAENPEDAAAAEAVGRYRCFVAEDWERGLPLLAKATDATLRRLASQDLAQPETRRDPAELVVIADAWWAYSASLSPGERDATRRRAGVWYLTAINSLNKNRRPEVALKEQRVPSEKAVVTLAGRVAAGDTLTIRRDGATWQSTAGQPTDIYVNKLPWNVAKEKMLSNRGASRFLPHGIHFGRARVQKLQGQQNPTMKVTGDEIVIGFPYAGIYQLLISFGS